MTIMLERFKPSELPVLVKGSRGQTDSQQRAVSEDGLSSIRHLPKHQASFGRKRWPSFRGGSGRADVSVRKGASGLQTQLASLILNAPSLDRRFPSLRPLPTTYSRGEITSALGLPELPDGTSRSRTLKAFDKPARGSKARNKLVILLWVIPTDVRQVGDEAWQQSTRMRPPGSAHSLSDFIGNDRGGVEQDVPLG